MFKAFSIFASALVLAIGLSFAFSPHRRAAPLGDSDEDRLMHAYAQIRIGMPICRFAALGFDAAKVERLSKVTLMGRFMPKDPTAFDALDPAVKNCYRGSDDCTAYIFGNYSEVTLFLVQDGRVTWKMKFDSVMAGSELSRATG